MAWWAKIIGGSAGYLIAGPVGGVIGLALGAIADGAIDDDPTSGIPELDIETRFIEDDFGRFVQLFFRKDVPNGAVVVALIHDSRGRPVRAVEAFAEKGNFVSHRAIERGKSEFYVPYSALQYRKPGVYTLMATVLFMAPGADQPTTLGQKTFDFELPPATTWSRLRFLEPLMGLCVYVLNAGRSPSSRGEKIILQFFIDSLQRHGSTDQGPRVPPEVFSSGQLW